MLWFDDNAEEAVNHYVSIFKNSLIVNIARYGEAGPRPKGSVMTISRFRVPDLHERTARLVCVIAQSSGMRSKALTADDDSILAHLRLRRFESRQKRII